MQVANKFEGKQSLILKVGHKSNRSLVKVVQEITGFIKGLAPGQRRGCEDDFGHLVLPSREKVFL